MKLFETTEMKNGRPIAEKVHYLTCIKQLAKGLRQKHKLKMFLCVCRWNRFIM